MRQEIRCRLEKIIDTLEGRQQLIDAITFLIQSEIRATEQKERAGRITKFKPNFKK